MDAALRAIADPNRRRILRLVRGRELPAGVIAGNFALSRPAVSQHIRVLKDAGLLDERRVATKRLYQTREDRVREIIQELGAFWDDRLEALKREAEAEQRSRNGS